MELRELAGTLGEWLRGDGPQCGIVISTRVRLARNMAGYPFLRRLTDDQRADIRERVSQAGSELDLITAPCLIDLGATSHMDRQFLVERHLISRELAAGEGPRAVLFSSSETESLMINEEDHLRIQVMRSGLQIDEAWRQAGDLDDRLETKLDFAFSSRLGYLTACPTNVGTGLRASVMMHLPALVITRQIEKVFQAIARMRLAVRGLYGEGTQAAGDFYQVSNQVTLGKTEEEILETLSLTIPRIIQYEEKARETLARESEVFIEDRIWRAVGLLSRARQISSGEATSLLSAVRMGLHMGRLRGLDVQHINRLFIGSQPGHLQVRHGGELSPEERDVERARFVRSVLKDVDLN
ncbi:MAG TPA: protein arginine kinase [Phycisphaerae bacterium]|nr:protein arginine kinase [Phycisphaerae bacterium]